MTMSSSQVRVLSVSHVRPDQTTEPPRHDHAAVKLSLFDAIFIATPPIQLLFLYEGPGLPPFPSLVRSLRSSLAAALAVFPPFTGKLTYVPSSGDAIIDCSPAAVATGLKFVEAETDADIHRLASDPEHDTEAFMRLVPALDVGRLPARVLAVQVTRSAGDRGAAVAVGFTMHHTAADGRSLWQFMHAWTAATREGASAARGLVPLTFDRAAIRHPRAEELARNFLRVLAPRLPEVNFPPVLSSKEELVRQRRKTFQLHTDQIQLLKQYILQQSKTTGHRLLKPPTTLVSISALVWISIVRANSLDHTNDAYLMFPVDCRRLLRPPVDDGFFGNCVKCCYATAMVGGLRGDDGLVLAAAAIQKAFHESLEEPLADVEQWMGSQLNIAPERMAVIGLSPHFMVYEMDFGWGKPRRVELASMPRNELVDLVAAREGGVQVSAALDGANMEIFEANFVVPTAVRLGSNL